MREELAKVEAPLSPSSTICALIMGDGNGNLSLSFSKDEPVKTSNQFLKRKVNLLLTEDGIRSFTHLVFYIEPFLPWRKRNVKNSTQSRVCPPKLLLMSKHPVGKEMNKNDPSLPKEIQH